ncbi:MAG: hypothetical protein KF740_20225 [Ramlibacter sp.]|nr:hypothetical protein [Ramlibacter sp.]
MKTAAQTYQETNQLCDQLVDRVKAALANHASQAAKEPASWQWVGDASHVSLDLLRVLNFMQALTPDEQLRYADVL